MSIRSRLDAIEATLSGTDAEHRCPDCSGPMLQSPLHKRVEPSTTAATQMRRSSARSVVSDVRSPLSSHSGGAGMKNCCPALTHPIASYVDRSGG